MNNINTLQKCQRDILQWIAHLHVCVLNRTLSMLLRCKKKWSQSQFLWKYTCLPMHEQYLSVHPKDVCCEGIQNLSLEGDFQTCICWNWLIDWSSKYHEYLQCSATMCPSHLTGTNSWTPVLQRLCWYIPLSRKSDATLVCMVSLSKSLSTLNSCGSHLVGCNKKVFYRSVLLESR